VLSLAVQRRADGGGGGSGTVFMKGVQVVGGEVRVGLAQV
jgi:hypothetical protein